MPTRKAINQLLTPEQLERLETLKDSSEMRGIPRRPVSDGREVAACGPARQHEEA